MNSLTLKSPAKVNLYLTVFDKKENGFHSIETLFERIDLCDELSFRQTKKDTITIHCNHPQVPAGSKNLVYKVAQTLKDAHGIESGVSIRIKKNIPVAAGLAGGSSNAAIALIALNRLWSIGLNKKQLAEYAASLGSDINFFLDDASFALGEDRGQIISPVKCATKLWHVLVVPKVKVYAKDAYQKLEILRSKVGVNASSKRRLHTIQEGGENLLTKQEQGVNILIRKLQKGVFSDIWSLLRNDLEEPVIGLCPRIKVVQQRFKSLEAKGVVVSGSGPAVFALVESKEKALAMQRALKKIYSQVFVVRTL